MTIALPNCPQAVTMFYAVNLIAAVANMIHPLSSKSEIEFYLNRSESVTAITLDQFYGKFQSVRKNTKLVNIIIARVRDALSRPIRAGYMLTEGRKIEKIPADEPVIMWNDFLNLSRYNVYPAQIENILDAHELVRMSCVIGVPDSYKMQKVKAFVCLKPGVPADEGTRETLMQYCRKHIAKFAMPCDIEFREDMPTTLVGKVAYWMLEEEELAKTGTDDDAPQE